MKPGAIHPAGLKKAALASCFGGFNRRAARRDDNFNGSIQPYATYRTMCVRLCDGYYFPVSFLDPAKRLPKRHVMSVRTNAPPLPNFTSTAILAARWNK